MISVIGSTKRKSITDLTGNVGGDTILFGLNFAKVESIEIDKDNFEVLKHNVETYKLKNVKLHFGDSTEIYNWKTDVLYLDPPWGGPEYKTKENLDLYLGDDRIDEFLEEILEEEWRPRYIFMKLPRNYNFKRLENLDVQHIHKFAIRGFFLIGMEV
jgi:tRNA G10  N-methylase Trm11